MLYYLFPIFFGFLYSLSRSVLKFKKYLFIEYFLIAFSLFIFCGGYMTGSDWVYYEPLYNTASLEKLSDFEKEKGFYVLILFFKFLGFSFFLFLFAVKAIVFLMFIRFLKKYNANNYILAFSFFLSMYALYIFIDNPLRFMIAMGFITLAFDCMLKNNLILFVGLTLLASLFHTSSLIILLAYFSKFSNISSFRILVAYVLLQFLWTPNTIIYLIEEFFPSAASAMNWYYVQFLAEQVDQSYSIGWYFWKILFLVILFNRSTIVNAQLLGYRIFDMCILYFFLTATVGAIPGFFRIPIFFSIFLYIALSISLSNFSKIRFLKIFIILYFFVSNIKNIHSSWVYLPYTNYFVFLFKNELPYDYRKSYNKNEYYIRNGKLPPEAFNPNEF
jgi:hypothetical protein